MDNIGDIIIEEEELRRKVKGLAEIINNDYKGKELIVISILKSSIYFAADITRYLNIPLKLDFLGISRYPGENKTGIVRVTRDLELSIIHKNVLIIESIINTGLTHSYLLKNLNPRNPKSIKICTLINNPGKRLVELPIQYSGFEIPDVFVVGYGLDYREKYRDLPYIAVYNQD